MVRIGTSQNLLALIEPPRPQGVASTLHSLAKMHQADARSGAGRQRASAAARLPPSFEGSLLSTVCDDLLYVSTQLLDSCSPQAFSNLVYAAAVLGLKPQRQWLSAFFRYSLPSLPSFSPQALSNTAWALAKMVGDGSCHAKTLSCLFGLAPLNPVPLSLYLNQQHPLPAGPRGSIPRVNGSGSFTSVASPRPSSLRPRRFPTLSGRSRRWNSTLDPTSRLPCCRPPLVPRRCRDASPLRSVSPQVGSVDLSVD